MSEQDNCSINTDRELWREREGDYYADSIFVTQSGGIGIHCGGFVVVKPLHEWFRLARPPEARAAQERAEPERTYGCTQCGRDYMHEPLTWSVTGIPARTFFFCSVACREAWHRGAPKQVGDLQQALDASALEGPVRESAGGTSDACVLSSPAMSAPAGETAREQRIARLVAAVPVPPQPFGLVRSSSRDAWEQAAESMRAAIVDALHATSGEVDQG